MAVAKCSSGCNAAVNSVSQRVRVVGASRVAGAPKRNVKAYMSDVRNSGFEKVAFGEDFGARDPTPGELASNFSEKVIGNWDTEHIIKPPDAIGNVLGLKSRSCKDLGEDVLLLTEADRDRLRQQVPGWRIANNSRGLACIRQDWKVKDAEAARELVQRIGVIGEMEGHVAECQVSETSSEVYAELSTASVGGLTLKDFIVAAKINDLNVSDLLAKRKTRFWA